MDKFVFDSIDTSALNAYVFPTNSINAAPARLYTTYAVPGRSGVLLMDDKRYENINREYGVIFADDGITKISTLRNMLLSKVGYCRLEDSFDSDHYFMAVYRESFEPEIEWINKKLAKIKIVFERMPQRFLKSGEITQTIRHSEVIVNPTRFNAKPLLRVYGYGTVTIRDVNITIEQYVGEYIDLDCESGRAYNGATALDRYVSLSTIDYPELVPGQNGIVFNDNISQIILTPRWWEI